MASIDSSLVREEIRKHIKLNQSAKNQVREAFSQLEADPSAFEELRLVSPEIPMRFPNVIIRKVKITGRNHDYRLIVAHWTLAERPDHVDVLLVFPRQQGYAIDWDWMKDTLDPPPLPDDPGE